MPDGATVGIAVCRIVGLVVGRTLGATLGTEVGGGVQALHSAGQFNRTASKPQSRSKKLQDVGSGIPEHVAVGAGVGCDAGDTVGVSERQLLQVARQFSATGVTEQSERKIEQI